VLRNTYLVLHDSVVLRNTCLLCCRTCVVLRNTYLILHDSVVLRNTILVLKDKRRVT
jgi:hypothetical protein